MTRKKINPRFHFGDMVWPTGFFFFFVSENKILQTLCFITDNTKLRFWFFFLWNVFSFINVLTSSISNETKCRLVFSEMPKTGLTKEECVHFYSYLMSIHSYTGGHDSSVIMYPHTQQGRMKIGLLLGSFKEHDGCPTLYSARKANVVPSIFSEWKPSLCLNLRGSTHKVHL